MLIYISDTARLQRVITACGRLSEPNAVAFTSYIPVYISDRSRARAVYAQRANVGPAARVFIACHYVV